MQNPELSKQRSDGTPPWLRSAEELVQSSTTTPTLTPPPTTTTTAMSRPPLAHSSEYLAGTKVSLDQAERQSAAEAIEAWAAEEASAMVQRDDAWRESRYGAGPSQLHVPAVPQVEPPSVPLPPRAPPAAAASSHMHRDGGGARGPSTLRGQLSSALGSLGLMVPTTCDGPLLGLGSWIGKHGPSSFGDLSAVAVRRVRDFGPFGVAPQGVSQAGKR